MCRWLYIHRPGVCVHRDIYRSTRCGQCIAVTGSRSTHVRAVHTHTSARSKVCVARAPHGNDESSTLEHLAAAASSRFRALSLTLRLCYRFGLSLSRPPPTPPRVCIGDRAYTRHQTHTEARGPRPCHDFAFVYALSLVTLSLRPTRHCLSRQ